MADSNPKYWIVLVNRIPQGPYTELEIKQLLAKQEFSRNEVGMQVSEDGKSRLSGWKILWQFEEFDRRRKKAGEGANEVAPPPVERRKSLSEPDIQKVTSEKVPEHLMEIAPEDLVPHRENRGTSVSDFSQESYSENESSASGRDYGWWPTAIAGVGAIGLVVMGAQWISGWMSEKPAVTARPQRQMERRISNQQRPATSRQRTTPLSGVRAPAESLPSAPSPEPMEIQDSYNGMEGTKDFGQVPETVFDDMGDQGESLRRRIQKRGRNIRKRRAIQPATPGDDAGVDEDFVEEDSFVEEEIPVDD
ncbi:MAG: hypothetical protein KDD39_09540, partial [Bdellovibrionales bacterium]|nr:hypothetical protein [Bdellovibrionales bacterium]